MDKLIRAVGDRYHADATLAGYLDEIGGEPAITQWRTFEHPKEMESKKPRIVYTLDGSPDELGLSGAAANVGLEVSVWGYGPAAIRWCLQAMQRLDELTLLRMEPNPGGGTLRWRAVTGWQRMDEPDVMTVRWVNTYITRYWSDGRMTALTS